MKISGKTAIVTGGASGLGEATAVRLYNAGANVVIVDLQEDLGQALAAKLGDRAIFVKGNITSVDEVQAFIKAAVDKFGAVHILANIAGIAKPGKVLGKEGPLDINTFKIVIDVNLVGTFNVLSQTAAVMAKNEGEDGEKGVIINVSSIAAYDGQVGQASYSASKGGVTAMTLPIAKELARSGIRVNTIVPGIFGTPMMAKMPEKARQALENMVPFPKRLGDPDEFAMVAEQIVVNSYINAENIRVDAGIRMI
ncbi:MAG: SDR family NAD(P)-dependent oxidoreductase [Syntrophomonadaceae bacterium]|jgi:NAD(P)-dependent dehydrogenase (short-subunit alcohol dehydrogenase family)|nr:SDR family NAD(P)-dependent oxidoreductase [Syntrophomonadaceae bacterium]